MDASKTTINLEVENILVIGSCGLGRHTTRLLVNFNIECGHRT